MNWAYLAGFLDGEGSFKMYKRDYPRITIGQKERAVLDAIQEFLGTTNTITLSNNCHYLQYCDRKVVLYIIENVYPFLIVKKADVDAILTIWHPDKIGV